MKSRLTQVEAVALCESGWWHELSYRERTEFQLFESRLCMPFGVFHEAVEKSLGRPVWPHEFASPESLRAEFLGDRESPTFGKIMSLIPEDKIIPIQI